MDEADEILMRSLRELGCDLEESTSLKDFTPEDVVSATVKCLKVLSSSVQLAPTLPPNMAARYKTCTQLAELCKDLGYTGDIGYQNFLYGSEIDVRNLFTFLISLLSKEKEKQKSDNTDQASSLKEIISTRLLLSNNLSWLPIHCKPNGLRKHDNDVWFIEGASTAMSPSYRYADINSSLSPLNLIASLLDINSSLCRQATSDESILLKKAKNSIVKEKHKKQFQEMLLKEFVNCDIKIQETSELKECGKAASIVEVEAISDENTIGLNAKPAPDNSVILNLESSMEKLKKDLEASENKNASLEKKISKAEGAITEMREGIVSERDHIDKIGETLKSAIQLCNYVEKFEDPEEELKNEIKSIVDKLRHMGSQWEKHRCALIEEYRSIKEENNTKFSNSNAIRMKVESLSSSVTAINEEIKMKEATSIELRGELEKLPKDLQRHSYTHRILEIINNINKQKVHIESIIADVKKVQKEINALEGKLLRSFNLADEVIFKDCKKDESARQAYKLLATCQETCDKVISFTKENGSIGREIMDLENLIENEIQKGATENLERILADCKQMKLENLALVKKLSAGHIN